MSGRIGPSVLIFRTLWALLLAIPGCEGESVIERPSSGVYQIVEWTVDETGCDGQGASVMGSRPEFVRVQTTQVGPTKLAMWSCEDEACEPVVRSRATSSDQFRWLMDEFVDDQWSGSQIDVRGSKYGCEAARAEVTVSITSGSRIWVGVRHLAVTPFPYDDDFVCTGDGPSRACSLAMAKEVTAGQPCVSREKMAAMIIDRDVRPQRPDWPRESEDESYDR